MPKGKSFSLRIEILDELLGYKKWKKDDLIARINEKLSDYSQSIKQRSFYDDINYLINEKGAPVHRPTRSNPYYYYTEQFSIMSLPLNDEEVGFLRKAIDILKQVNNFQMLGEVETIIQKLENRVNTYSTEKSPEIIQFEKQPLVKGGEYIDDLFEAIKSSSSVKLNYQPFAFAEPAEFVVFPYLLKEYRNRWFLFARKYGDNKITTYALDRVVSMNNSSVVYEILNSFDPTTYFKHLVGVSLPYGALPEKIILKVDKSSAPYIKTKKLHESQQIVKEYSDGSLLVEFFIIINYELKSLLLGYGPGIEVKKPDSLRNAIKEILKESISKYKKV